MRMGPMSYGDWLRANSRTNDGDAWGEYETYARREREQGINRGATFHRAGLQADGETMALPAIEIGQVQVYAYVQDGGLVVSIHLDGASGGVFKLYGPDKCVPLTVNVGDEAIWIVPAPES